MSEERTIKELFYSCLIAGEFEDQVTKEEAERLYEWFDKITLVAGEFENQVTKEESERFYEWTEENDDE